MQKRIQTYIIKQAVSIGCADAQKQALNIELKRCDGCVVYNLCGRARLQMNWKCGSVGKGVRYEV